MCNAMVICPWGHNGHVHWCDKDSYNLADAGTPQPMGRFTVWACRHATSGLFAHRGLMGVINALGTLFTGRGSSSDLLVSIFIVNDHQPKALQALGIGPIGFSCRSHEINGTCGPENVMKCLVQVKAQWRYVYFLTCGNSWHNQSLCMLLFIVKCAKK